MEFIYEVYPGLIKIVKRSLNGQTVSTKKFEFQFITIFLDIFKFSIS